MAKASKTTPKKAARKASPAISEKAIAKSRDKAPIKIILEIVLKRESVATKEMDLRLLREEAAPTVGYTFVTNHISVLKLEIENKNVQKPGKTGSIELDFVPPSGMISVSSMATGQGTGCLQLTYNGKNVFAAPVDFNFTNGVGFINETPQLP